MKSKRIERKEIIDRLHKSLREERPIIGACCSLGIIAKCAQLAGADLIIVYGPERPISMGIPMLVADDSKYTPAWLSWLASRAMAGLENPNKATIETGREIMLVSKDIPIIAGISANDPVLRIEKVLQDVVEAEFSGVINFPTVGPDHLGRNMYRSYGFGFEREVEMLRMASSLGLFTMGYVFSWQDAKAMAQSGVDGIVADVDWEKVRGARRGDERLADVRAICEAALREDPDIILLAHDRGSEDVSDTQGLYESTRIVGFLGSICFEKNPIEKGVKEAVRAFKAIQVKGNGGKYG